MKHLLVFFTILFIPVIGKSQNSIPQVPYAFPDERHQESPFPDYEITEYLKFRYFEMLLPLSNIINPAEIPAHMISPIPGSEGWMEPRENIWTPIQQNEHLSPEKKDLCSRIRQIKYPFDNFFHRFPDRKNLHNAYEIGSEAVKKSQNEELFTQRLDSVVRTIFHSNMEGWLVDYRRHYTLNDSGNIILYEEARLDEETRKLITQYKYSSTYDVDQKTLLTETLFIMDDQQQLLLPYEYYTFEYSVGTRIMYTDRWNQVKEIWEKNSKSANYYNENNYIDSVYSWSWDTISSSWVNSSRTYYQYHEDYSLLEQLYLNWDGDKSAWINSIKYEYEYNELGYRTLYLRSVWDTLSMDWIFDYKNEEVYDDSGNRVENSSSTWLKESSEWEMTFRSTYEFNDNNLNTDQIYYTWNYDSMKLFPNYNYEYYYTLDGYQEGYFLFEWNLLDSKWDTIQRSIYMLDDAGYPSSIITDKLNYYDEWTHLLKSDYTYDQEGRMTSRINYQWNGYAWSQTNKYEYEYPVSRYRNYETARWVNDISGWETISEKYEYATGGYLIMEDYKDFNLDMTLDHQYRTQYTFNDSGEVDTIMDWEFDEETGAAYLDGFAVISHNELNRIKGYQWLYWDATLKKFIPEDRAEFTYDQQGNIIVMLDQWWDGDIGSWINWWKGSSSYNEKGSLVEHLEQKWDTTLLDWVNRNKQEYSPDDKGNNLNKITYYWWPDSSKWRPDLRYEYLYNLDDQLILQKISHWNNDVNQWYATDSTVYSYDAQGSLIQRENFRFQDEVWESRRKTINEYDTYGNLTIKREFNYVDAYTSDFEDYRTAYTYDLMYHREEILMPYDKGFYAVFDLEGGVYDYDYLKEGMILSIIHSIRSAPNESWTISEKETFYYSDKAVNVEDDVSIDKAIMIYPNPANDRLYFNLDGQKFYKTNVMIYGFNGTLLLTETLDYDGSIDINSLANGIYIVRIQTGKNHYTRKFIKSSR